MFLSCGVSPKCSIRSIWYESIETKKELDIMTWLLRLVLYFHKNQTIISTQTYLWMHLCLCAFYNHTYNKKSKKYSCELATIHPMKNPTAILLWKRRIIIVPTTLSNTIISEDQILEKPSPGDRFAMTQRDTNKIRRESASMEYLCVAMFILFVFWLDLRDEITGNNVRLVGH